MKKILLVLGIVFCMWKLCQAQTIVPGSTFPIVTNLTQFSNLRYLGVDPLGRQSSSANTRSNFTTRFETLDSYFGGNATNYTDQKVNALAPNFPWLIVTNGSATATIQSQFNSLTNGGVAAFQPGIYTITSSLLITNPMVIEGNGATLSFALNATNAMVYCPTNYEKSLFISNLRFDGGQYSNYVSSFYFQLYAPNGNDAQPYHNQYWTNRTGLKLQITGGVSISHCYFYGWAGSGSIFYSLAGDRALGSGYSPQAPKLSFTYNTAYSNFMGCMLAISREDISGYFNGDTTGLGNWPCEYSAIFGNDLNQNYIAIYAAPGNCLVENNMLSGNWHGLYVNGGQNSAHGTYEGNVMNHNMFPIWSWFARGGLYQGNSIWRNPGDNNTSGGIHFDHCSEVSFVNNRITYDALTFTNDCDGTFAHNIFETNGVWGGAGTSYAVATNLYTIPTNFIGSPLFLIYDNHGAGGWRHDGSMISILASATNASFAGAIPSTPDGTNAAWIVPTSGTSFTTTSNPTNQFVRSTLYSNGSSRGLLVGSTIGNAGSGTAQQTLLYTNNGVGYYLPLVDLASSAKQIATFSVPLSPNATFFFNSVLSGSGTADLTNVVLWAQ